MSERLFNSFIPPKKTYTPKKEISGYAPGHHLSSVGIKDPGMVITNAKHYTSYMPQEKIQVLQH